MDTLLDELLYIVAYNLDEVATLSLSLVAKRIYQVVTRCMTDRIIKHFGYLPNGKLSTLFVDRHLGGVPCAYDFLNRSKASLGELSLQRCVRRLVNMELEDTFYAITMENVLVRVNLADLKMDEIHRDVKDVYGGIFTTNKGVLHDLRNIAQLPTLKDCHELLYWSHRVDGSDTKIFYLTKDKTMIKYRSCREGHSKSVVCTDVLGYYAFSTTLCATPEQVVVVHENGESFIIPIIVKKCIMHHSSFICIADNITNMDACLVFSSKLVKDIAACGDHHLAILYHDGRLTLYNMRNRKRAPIDTHVISIESRFVVLDYLCYIRSPTL